MIFCGSPSRDSELPARQPYFLSASVGSRYSYSLGEHSNFAVECGELRAVLIRMVPVYRIHLCIRILPTIRQINTCDRFVLSLRDRRLPQIEIVHESDFALPFSNGMTILGLRLSIVKELASTRTIRPLTEFLNSEAGNFSMTIRPHSTIADASARRAIRSFPDLSLIHI